MNFNEGAYIYINKPYRMSSFGALAHIRYVVSKRLHVKRVKMGHAGTLDPLATGVLILCTGKATKQIEQLQLHTKEYTATLQLGATTASFDKEHTVDYTYPTKHITRELILKTLSQFVGDQMQVPPVYSACMVAGDRAYELARKGQEVELAAKPIHIDEIELTAFDPVAMQMSIRVVCGKGTYIPFASPRHRLCIGQRRLPDGPLPYQGRGCEDRGLPDIRRLPRLAGRKCERVKR